MPDRPCLQGATCHPLDIPGRPAAWSGARRWYVCLSRFEYRFRPEEGTDEHRACADDRAARLGDQRHERTAMKFHWFLPTNGGDGRHVVSGGHGVEHGVAGRPASVPYLGQIARSAEQLGFEAALTPTGAWCEDAWLTTAMLAPLSERLKFLVAFRPGLTSPTLAAQMAATFQNLTGRPAAPQRRHGRRVPRAARLRRLPRQGRALRALRRVPRDRPPPVGGGGGHLRRPPPARRPGQAPAACPTRCRRSTSVARRRPPAGSPPSTPTSTSPGASRPPRSRRRSPGSRSSPSSTAVS